MPKPKRYAAGRARALGLQTRGTTNRYRLRRVDRHLAQVHADLLRTAATPLVIDLGYGANPVTAVELHLRLSEVRPDVQVVGLEIDPDRVAAAQSATRDRLAFRYGGFELAGLRPLVVRAFNVLRQYDESTAHEAWTTIVAGLQGKGLLMEGTCDELGRRAAWVTLTKEGPQTLTLAAHLQTLDRPGDLAERLPKALIHHNVPRERRTRVTHRARRGVGPERGLPGIREPAALEGDVRAGGLAAGRGAPRRRGERPLGLGRARLTPVTTP